MPEWNPNLYQSRHGFVYEFGEDVVTLLEPKRGERIVDLGCGTGQLTAKIAETGARVIGVDSSSAMIEEARRLYPHVRFEVADGATFKLDEPVDAVFSNAALHWMTRAPEVAQRIHAALKPGGRLVAEFGGHGNVARMMSCIDAGLAKVGISAPAVAVHWYFPSIGEYAAVLEQSGFEVRMMNLFDRPTPLEGDKGLRNWITMFGQGVLGQVPREKMEAFFAAAQEHGKGMLFHDGKWWADYVRLRLRAVKAPCAGEPRTK